MLIKKKNHHVLCRSVRFFILGVSQTLVGHLLPSSCSSLLFFSWMFWMGTDPRSVPFDILAGRCSKACASFPCSLIHPVRLVSDRPSGCICRVSGRRLNCDARQVLLLMVTFRRRGRGGGASVLGGMEVGEGGVQPGSCAAICGFH